MRRSLLVQTETFTERFCGGFCITKILKCWGRVDGYCATLTQDTKKTLIEQSNMSKIVNAMHEFCRTRIDYVPADS